MHPIDFFIVGDALMADTSYRLDKESVDWDFNKETSETYLELFMEREQLRWVQSYLYFYLELLRGGRLCYHMRFPFVNSRDWVHIIAETFQMDYQRINLNTAKPDESIELWNISTEFYPLKSLPTDREDIILQLKPHSTKSFDTTNVIVTIRSIYKFPSVYLSIDVHEKVEQLFWKGHIQFSNQNLIHVISLQGEHQKVSMQNIENNTNATLNVYWLETSNKKFHSYRYVQIHRSCNDHLCLKYITSEADASLDGPTSLDFAFIYQKYEENTTYNGTWLEAYELCNHFDGYLPIFRSREEIDQLISVLKLPQVTPPPIRIMFIGLMTHQVSKVSTKW